MDTSPDRGATPTETGDVERHIDYYRQMVLIRKLEELVQVLFLRGKVYGSTHLCIGQEAVSVGICSAVTERDWVAATYRGHGHILALGSDPQGLLEELMGRSGGTCGGRSGSMNIVDLSHRLIGCFGIVGGSIAAATGAALSLKLQREGGAAIALFGDGTANHGYFHECLNFAKVQELPIVFVCENNQYSEYTAVEEVTPGGITARPAAMDIPASTVDGNDVWAMREAGEQALERARGGGGPVFLEAFTYRFSDHGRGDPIDYRKPGEVERWKERDPLVVARQRLTGQHGVEASMLDAVDDEIAAELDRLSEAALASPFPEPAPSPSSREAVG